MPALYQYGLESISLGSETYSGSSFSMPNSAGVRRSTDDEEDEENMQTQQNASGTLPLNEPDDTEERMLHSRVYT